MTDQRRRRVPPWVRFTALRLLCFGVPLAVIYALSANFIVSAAFAAVLGLCFSVIFLGRQRSETVGSLLASKAPAPRRSSADEAAEDGSGGAEDGQNASAAASPKP